MSNLHALLVTTVATRQKLRPLLDLHADVRVVGETHSLRDARDMLAMLSVDVVIVQTSLAGEDGFELLPYIPIDTRVICLTSDAPEMMRALAYGSLECVPLPVQPRVLASALGRMRSGGTISPLRSFSFA